MAGRRLTAYYVVLARRGRGGADAGALRRGHGGAEPAIAGGYDVTAGPGLRRRAVRPPPVRPVRQPAAGRRLGRRQAALRGRPADGRRQLPEGRQAAAARRPSAAARSRARSATSRSRPTSPASRPTRAPRSRRRPARSRGEYKLIPRSACLGGKVELTGVAERRSSSRARASRASSPTASGKLTGTRHLRGRRRGRGRRHRLQPRDHAHVAREQPPEGAPPTEKVSAQKKREFGHAARRVLHRRRDRDAGRAAGRHAGGARSASRA